MGKERERERIRDADVSDRYTRTDTRYKGESCNYFVISSERTTRASGTETLAIHRHVITFALVSIDNAGEKQFEIIQDKWAQTVGIVEYTVVH